MLVQNQAFNPTSAVKMKMKMNSNAKAFSLTSTSLYKHIYQSIVRELVCNGIDACREINVDTPVVINIPILEGEEFFVQDFGVGMSLETILSVFMVYFNSLKEGNEKSIGGYGLGGKTPFAYTKQFKVETTCPNDHVRRTVVFTKDEGQEPDVLYDESLDEVNSDIKGTKVSFLLKHQQDSDNFYSALSEILFVKHPVQLKYMDSSFTIQKYHEKCGFSESDLIHIHNKLSQFGIVEVIEDKNDTKNNKLINSNINESRFFGGFEFGFSKININVRNSDIVYPYVIEHENVIKNKNQNQLYVDVIAKLKTYFNLSGIIYFLDTNSTSNTYFKSNKINLILDFPISGVVEVHVSREDLKITDNNNIVIMSKLNDTLPSLIDAKIKTIESMIDAYDKENLLLSAFKLNICKHDLKIHNTNADIFYKKVLDLFNQKIDNIEQLLSNYKLASKSIYKSNLLSYHYMIKIITTEFLYSTHNNLRFNVQKYNPNYVFNYNSIKDLPLLSDDETSLSNDAKPNVIVFLNLLLDSYLKDVNKTLLNDHQNILMSKFIFSFLHQVFFIVNNNDKPISFSSMLKIQQYTGNKNKQVNKMFKNNFIFFLENKTNLDEFKKLHSHVYDCNSIIAEMKLKSVNHTQKKEKKVILKQEKHSFLMNADYAYMGNPINEEEYKKLFKLNLKYMVINLPKEYTVANYNVFDLSVFKAIKSSFFNNGVLIGLNDFSKSLVKNVFYPIKNQLKNILIFNFMEENDYLKYAENYSLTKQFQNQFFQTVNDFYFLYEKINTEKNIDLIINDFNVKAEASNQLSGTYDIRNLNDFLNDKAINVLCHHLMDKTISKLNIEGICLDNFKNLKLPELDESKSNMDSCKIAEIVNIQNVYNIETIFKYYLFFSLFNKSIGKGLKINELSLLINNLVKEKEHPILKLSNSIVNQFKKIDDLKNLWCEYSLSYLYLFNDYDFQQHRYTEIELQERQQFINNEKYKHLKKLKLKFIFSLFD